MTSMKSDIKEEVNALGQFQQNRQGDNEINKRYVVGVVCFVEIERNAQL